MKKVTLLVTGCGGDIGQSIGKILNHSVYISKLFGCDISEKNAAKFIYKNFSISLPCNHPDYLNHLISFIEINKIDFVLPIAEPELRFFTSTSKVSGLSWDKMILASNKALSIGFDKLKTAEFLAKEGMPFPATSALELITEPKELPVILKSKTGSGSSKVHFVEDIEAFHFLVKRNPDFIMQEYLKNIEGEYTCGLFRSSNGTIRSIILKRELTGGYSGYGQVVAHNEISELLIKIAVKLNLIGSINVQLRLVDNIPFVFEINPRFSSTVLFRHMFGFRDVEWSIQDKLGIALSEYNANNIGKKFYKGFAEYISK